ETGSVGKELTASVAPLSTWKRPCEPSARATSTWSPTRRPASLANTAGPVVESRWPRITAGPASPGTDPSLYQPAWRGSAGTSMVPSGARPRSVMLASTPIEGIRMCTGGALWPNAAAAAPGPLAPSIARTMGVVTGIIEGVALGTRMNVPAVAAGELVPAPDEAGVQPARRAGAARASHHEWPGRTPDAPRCPAGVSVLPGRPRPGE